MTEEENDMSMMVLCHSGFPRCHALWYEFRNSRRVGRHGSPCDTLWWLLWRPPCWNWALATRLPESDPFNWYLPGRKWKNLWHDMEWSPGQIGHDHVESCMFCFIWQLIQLSELQGEDLVMASTKLLLKRKFMWPKTPKLKTKKLVHLGTNIADALASMKVDSSTNKERKLGTLYFCHPTNLAVLDGKQMWGVNSKYCTVRSGVNVRLDAAMMFFKLTNPMFYCTSIWQRQHDGYFADVADFVIHWKLWWSAWLRDCGIVGLRDFCASFSLAAGLQDSCASFSLGRWSVN